MCRLAHRLGNYAILVLIMNKVRFTDEPTVTVTAGDAVSGRDPARGRRLARRVPAAESTCRVWCLVYCPVLRYLITRSTFLNLVGRGRDV